MNTITDVCVMDLDAERVGYGVYYRVSFITQSARPLHDETWKLFGDGYDLAGAIQQADQLLGHTHAVLEDGPGEGVGCGNYFGAFNAPFAYRKRAA